MMGMRGREWSRILLHCPLPHAGLAVSPPDAPAHLPSSAFQVWATTAFSVCLPLKGWPHRSTWSHQSPLQMYCVSLSPSFVGLREALQSLVSVSHWSFTQPPFSAPALPQTPRPPATRVFPLPGTFFPDRPPTFTIQVSAELHFSQNLLGLPGCALGAPASFVAPITCVTGSVIPR